MIRVHSVPRLLCLTAIVLMECVGLPATTRADDVALMRSVKRLAKSYIEGFGHPNTKLCYHHRLNGSRGVAALSSPGDVAKRVVRGRPMSYGYGSGIQDVPLENGQFLLALCDAYDATKDDEFAALARHIFQGMKLVAAVSPEPGFVPRGPHPDGKSYYPDSSRDQTCAFVAEPDDVKPPVALKERVLLFLVKGARWPNTVGWLFCDHPHAGKVTCYNRQAGIEVPLAATSELTFVMECTVAAVYGLIVGSACSVTCTFSR